MSESSGSDRREEWFVPRFGPARLRLAVGLLFLPYTGMVLAYTVIGSMLAPAVHWDRVGAIVAIYFLALGVGAHALDALGSPDPAVPRPWGEVFSRRRLKALAGTSLVLAYAIGLYYMIVHTPWLWVIAILEGFFLFAYNLEWYGGRFHTDGWFALSWGGLPVLAGYVLQTNALAPAAVLAGAAMALLSLVEIKASRPYKAIRRRRHDASEREAAHAAVLESVLRHLSAGVVTLAVALVLWRWAG